MPHTQFPTLVSCALCLTETDLQRSHILPDFLLPRLRGASGSFIAASAPRKQIQAGPAVRMLCFACEQRFSRWEQSVQRTLFPHNKHVNLPIVYGPWLYRFAVSISWRGLTFLKLAKRNEFEKSPPAAMKLLPTLPEAQHLAAESKLAAWANLLLIDEANPSSCSDQHLVFLNGENVPNEHSQVIGFTMYETDDTTAIFTQLGPVCAIGFIRSEVPNSWQGTEIVPTGGEFPIRSQSVPSSFHEWLKQYFSNISSLEA